jgi:hypothetical protein
MRRALLAAALTASLMTPGAGQTRLLDPLWSFLASLWTTPPTKEGCGMDPSGLCRPAARPASDAGCGMDPNGRCNPAALPASDGGCGMDPSGRCLNG